MKLLARLFLITAIAAPMAATAMDDIMFRVGDATIEGEATEAQVEALKLKAEQILGRNSSGAGDAYCAFVLKPTLAITGSKTSEGLTRNVTLSEGELTLSFCNAYDNAVYYSAVYNLESSVTGGKSKGIDGLINAIKVKDPAYTRLIRTARTKIEEYYESNCDRILARAKTLMASEQFADAASYLSALPDNAPCYEEGAELLATATRLMPKSVEKAAEEKTEENATEENTEEATTEEVPADSDADKKAVKKPDTDKSEPDIYISNEDFSVRILSCKGSKVHRNVAITVEIVNDTNKNRYNCHTFLDLAYSSDGTPLELQREKNNYPDLPAGVKVKHTFHAAVTDTTMAELSFVKFNIGGTRVEIRNLPIEW